MEIVKETGTLLGVQENQVMMIRVCGGVLLLTGEGQMDSGKIRGGDIHDYVDGYRN